MPECFVAKASEMQDGDRRIVVAGNAEIGVFYKDGAYFAYSNTCVHAGGPACEGLMINRVVDVIAADRTYQGRRSPTRFISSARGTVMNTSCRPANASATGGCD